MYVGNVVRVGIGDPIRVKVQWLSPILTDHAIHVALKNYEALNPGCL